MAAGNVQTFHVVAPCGCVVAHITATNATRAWQVLFGADANARRATHKLRPVNHDLYEKTPRPYRGRCPHLENAS